MSGPRIYGSAAAGPRLPSPVARPPVHRSPIRCRFTSLHVASRRVASLLARDVRRLVRAYLFRIFTFLGGCRQGRGRGHARREPGIKARCRRTDRWVRMYGCVPNVSLVPGGPCAVHLPFWARRGHTVVVPSAKPTFRFCRPMLAPWSPSPLLPTGGRAIDRSGIGRTNDAVGLARLCCVPRVGGKTHG